MKAYKLIAILLIAIFASPVIFSQEIGRDLKGLKKSDYVLSYINFDKTSSVKMTTKLLSKQEVSLNSLGGIKTFNGWIFLDMFGTVTDSVKSQSYFGSDGYQVFPTFGKTKNFFGKNYLQSTRYKEFWDPWKDYYYPYFPLPDTIAIDVKINNIVGRDNILSIGVTIPTQDTLGYGSGGGKEINMNDTTWQTIWFEKSHEKTFMKNIGRLYLVFLIETKDSNYYVGMDIEARDIRGIDSMGVVIYDSLRDHTVGIFYDKQIPTEFILSQNYPNPFNPYTTIRFTIPKREYVSLKVFNLLGQEVKNLVSEEKEQGVYEVSFDAFNLSSGTYFYRLQSGSFVETKKMQFLK